MLGDKKNEIPEILNTIENDYSKIYLIGEDEFSLLVEEYFCSNSNIEFERLSDSDFIEQGNSMYLDLEVSGEEMLVFADLRPEHPIMGKNGKGFQTFYFSRFYANGIKTTENLQDIEQNIIPRLIDCGVYVIRVCVPDINRLHGRKAIQLAMYSWSAIRHISTDIFDSLRRKKEHTEYLKEETRHLSNDNSKGYSLMYGNGKYMNFDNGFRRTIGNPRGEVPQIYFFGPCFIRGLGCADQETIPSMIQDKVGAAFRVLNYGSEFQTMCYIMRLLEYKAGDVVVIFSPDKKNGLKREERVTEVDLTDVYNGIPHVERHIFDLPVHFDKVIQKEIVNVLYDKIQELQNSTAKTLELDTSKIYFGPQIRRAADIRWEKEVSFLNWISDLRARFPEDKSKRRGAIVMNCNPFTYGHRYLIETASKQVDELIVFVVEEDKSIFKFKDRLRLVKLGAADLSNVIVTESGNYMISSVTLPGYFEKSKLQDTYLDAGNDLMLFTRIAQNLNISVRFAGAEPLDHFTEQYNRSMETILSRYGIRFVEIPRKEEGNKVISASRVRAALEEQNWDEIRLLVPDTTYDFLKNM